MKRNKDYIFRSVAGEAILVPVGQEAKKFNGIINLNSVAAFMWEHMEEAETEDDMVKLVTDAFEVDHQQAEIDVKEFLQMMRSKGLVE